jgi:hypothetical protein
VLPRDRLDYVLDLPSGIPPLRPAPNDSISNGTTLDVPVAIDRIEAVDFDDGQRTRTLILMRVQPTGATLRNRSDGQVIASVGFPRTEWQAASPPPAVLWPRPVPGQAEQVLGAPHGAELSGIRLGMALADAE